LRSQPGIIRNFEQTDFSVFPYKADDRGGKFLTASGISRWGEVARVNHIEAPQ